MLSSEKIFDDWFNDDGISFADLEAGSRDHLDRLRQGNEQGRFDALITATDARYLAYFGQRAQDATARSTGKATTTTLDQATVTLRHWLTTAGLEAVRYKIKDEATRLRFYPDGNTEYHRATDAEWPGLLTRYGKAVEEFGSQLDADFKTTYITHSQALLAALREQSGQNQQKAEARVGTRAERAALTRQLSRNARTLGLLFDEHPAHAATYFDKQYFNQHQPASLPPIPPTTPPN